MHTETPVNRQITQTPNISEDSAHPHSCAPNHIYNRSRIVLILQITCIATLSVFCFFNTLHCSFFADDFIHLERLHRAFTQDPQLLFTSFVSAWQDRTVHLFFRPLVTLSLAIDYAFWAGNPFGYHLSNVLLHAAASCLVFFISRELWKDRWGHSTGSFIAGCLFAAYPLHTEVVAWTICRVDGLSTTFYLLSLWLFLYSLRSGRSGGMLLPLVSLSAFAASLLAKEMAVTLPVALTLASLFGIVADRSQITDEFSLKDAFRRALRSSCPYWLVLFAYALLRFAVIGHLVGGYHGSAGSSLNDSVFERWIASGSLTRLFYPLNAEIVRDHTLEYLLQMCYTALGAWILINAREGNPFAGNARLMAFCSLWLVICLLPTVQVWHLLSTLTGARFAYLASAPLCILLSLALAPHEYLNMPAKPRARQVFSCTLSTALICLFAAATIENNKAYLNASGQMESLKRSITTEFARDPERRVVITNLPVTYQGAHMFYSFEMLEDFLKPPFSNVDASMAVAAMQPRSHCAVSIFNRSRMQEMLASTRFRFFEWDFEKRNLEPMDAKTQANLLQPPLLAPQTLESTSTSSAPWQQSLKISNAPNLPLESYDFVDVEIAVDRAEPPVTPAHLVLIPSPDISARFSTYIPANVKPLFDGSTKTYRFSVGERNAWSQSKHIEAINLVIKGGTAQADCRATFRSRADCVPALRVDTDSAPVQPDGTHCMTGASVNIRFDATNIADASAIVAEISEPYSMFDQLPGKMRDDKTSKYAIASLRSNQIKGSMEIPRQLLPIPAWYQVRVAALSASGKVAGYFSDPVYISRP